MSQSQAFPTAATRRGGDRGAVSVTYVMGSGRVLHPLRPMTAGHTISGRAPHRNRGMTLDRGGSQTRRTLVHMEVVESCTSVR